MWMETKKLSRFMKENLTKREIRRRGSFKVRFYLKNSLKIGIETSCNVIDIEEEKISNKEKQSKK